MLINLFVFNIKNFLTIFYIIIININYELEYVYIGKNYVGVTHGKIYEIIDTIKIKGKLSYYFINDDGTVDLRRASLFKETTLTKNLKIIEEMKKED